MVPGSGGRGWSAPGGIVQEMRIEGKISLPTKDNI
jgi:hypothetical protein